MKENLSRLAATWNHKIPSSFEMQCERCVHANPSLQKIKLLMGNIRFNKKLSYKTLAYIRRVRGSTNLR